MGAWLGGGAGKEVALVVAVLGSGASAAAVAEGCSGAVDIAVDRCLIVGTVHRLAVMVSRHNSGRLGRTLDIAKGQGRVGSWAWMGPICDSGLEMVVKTRRQVDGVVILEKHETVTVVDGFEWIGESHRFVGVAMEVSQVVNRSEVHLKRYQH